MINKNVPLWLTTNLDVSSSFINYCHSALKNTMLRVQALRIQSNSRSCAFLVQSRAFNVNRRELGSTADNCSQHTPPKNYPTEMQVDHVLDKLYKQVESDDDDFLIYSTLRSFTTNILSKYRLPTSKQWLIAPGSDFRTSIERTNQRNHT